MDFNLLNEKLLAIKGIGAVKAVQIVTVVKGCGFSVFDGSEYVGAICVKGCAEYTRKQLDELTEWVKRPQVGAKGLVYVKFTADGRAANVPSS